MVKATKSKSSGTRNPKHVGKPAADPRQLGLFDALEAVPAAAARKLRVKAPKAKTPRSEALARPVVLSPCDAAQYLGVSVSTLKNWRARKIGPKWIMRGARLVAYRPADLEKFLDDSSAKR